MFCRSGSLQIFRNYAAQCEEHTCYGTNHVLKQRNGRRSLGDFIGRAIRVHLRRYYNPVLLPVPITLYSDGDDLPDYSSSRSRIHEILLKLNFEEIDIVRSCKGFLDFNR